MGLQCLVHNVSQSFAAEYLVHRTFCGETFDHSQNCRRVMLGYRLQCAVDIAHCAVGHGVANVATDRHLTELLLDHAKGGNRSSKLLALPRVSQGVVQSLSGASQVQSTQLQAPEIQDVEGDLVPLAHFPKHVFNRHTHVFEEKGGRRRTIQPEFRFLTSTHYSHLALDNESRELLPVNLCENREHVGKATVGNKHLLAVQDVVSAVVA